MSIFVCIICAKPLIRTGEPRSDHDGSIETCARCSAQTNAGVWIKSSQKHKLEVPKTTHASHGLAVADLADEDHVGVRIRDLANEIGYDQIIQLCEKMRRQETGPRNPDASHAGGPAPPPMPTVPMLLWCPECRERHVDPDDMPPHKTHACQSCGMNWRPANIPTQGVQFLPGCKD